MIFIGSFLSVTFSPCALRFYFSAQQGSNIRGGGGGLNESLLFGEHLFPQYLCLLDLG